MESEKYHAPYETGPEYQLIDDDNYEFELEDWQKTVSDYGLAETGHLSLQDNGSKVRFRNIKNKVL